MGTQWKSEIKSRLRGSKTLMRTDKHKGTEARERLRDARMELNRLRKKPVHELDIDHVRDVFSSHDQAVEDLTGRRRLSHPPLNP